MLQVIIESSVIIVNRFIEKDAYLKVIFTGSVLGTSL